MKTLNNGKIKTFKDKLDNTHFDLGTDNETYASKKKMYNMNQLLENSRFEIYSVLTNNNKILNVGDKFENGFISDFFINTDDIYVRFVHIISKDNNICLKKNCSLI